jgi:hypothetical protein
MILPDGKGSNWGQTPRPAGVHLRASVHSVWNALSDVSVRHGQQLAAEVTVRVPVGARRLKNASCSLTTPRCIQKTGYFLVTFGLGEAAEVRQARVILRPAHAG